LTFLPRYVFGLVVESMKRLVVESMKRLQVLRQVCEWQIRRRASLPGSRGLSQRSLAMFSMAPRLRGQQLLKLSPLLG
jgi:hypothetical protein